MDAYLLEVFKAWDGTPESKSYNVRNIKRQSAIHLRNYPTKEVIDTLVKLVEKEYDGDEECCMEAIDSLCYLSIEKAIMPIFNQLVKVAPLINKRIYYEDNEREVFIYESGLKALLKLGGVPSLIKLLLDCNNHNVFVTFTRFCNCSDWEVKENSHGIPDSYLKILSEWNLTENSDINERVLYYLLRRKYEDIGKLGNDATDFLIEYINEYTNIMEYKSLEANILSCQYDIDPLTSLITQLGVLKDNRASDVLIKLHSQSSFLHQSNLGDSEDETYVRTRLFSLLEEIRTAYRLIENKDIYKQQVVD